MTCVMADNGLPRSIIFLSFRTPGTLTSITFLPGLSDAEDDRVEGDLAIRLIGLDFVVNLSSAESFCVLFELTSEQTVELKWLMLNQNTKDDSIRHV